MMKQQPKKLRSSKNKKIATVSTVRPLVIEKKRPTGLKFLVECRCFLPQYKNFNPPIYHKFVVFSKLDDNANVIPSYVACPNCGIIHKIVEVGVSKILNKEESGAVVKIEDIKTTLPEKLANLLTANECDLATWMNVQFIVENKLWGEGVVLSKEREETSVFGKFLIILGETLFKVENFSRDEGLI